MIRNLLSWPLLRSTLRGYSTAIRIPTKAGMSTS